MELPTYKAVSFKDRLTQALNELDTMVIKLEKKGKKYPEQQEFLFECARELLDMRNTLGILHKELKEYITQ